jgi:hypothetical protein
MVLVSIMSHKAEGKSIIKKRRSRLFFFMAVQMYAGNLNKKTPCHRKLDEQGVLIL